MSKMDVALMIKIFGEIAKKKIEHVRGFEQILLSFPPYEAQSYLRYSLQQASYTPGSS